MIGDDWKEFEKTICTPEESAVSGKFAEELYLERRSSALELLNEE